MPEFIITVPVTCATQAEAEQVAAERLAHDEDYGFDYQFGAHSVTPTPKTEEEN